MQSPNDHDHDDDAPRAPQDPSDESEDLEFRSTDGLAQTQEELDERHRQELIEYSPEFQRIVLPEGATVGDAVAFLNKAVPQNEYGLPAFFYRSDMLPALEFLSQDSANAAVVSLDYYEGYPTYSGGKLWWFQLPHEPFDAFMLFQRYLDQVEEHGMRQLQLLAQENAKSFEWVRNISLEYYWSGRARAYDLFQIAADRKRKEARQRRLEDEHYRTADRLMAPLKAKFENPEFFDNLTAKEALECLRLLINIQRVSNGLAQNGNAGRQEYNPDGAKAGAMLMRQITEGAGMESEAVGLNEGLMSLLADPSFAFEAQKLVIRVRAADKLAEPEQVKIIDE